MAPTSMDGSRRENCPLLSEEAVMRHKEWINSKKVYESNWRASSVPAAAVIPTPRVSMIDAAVKKSVVVYAMKGYRSKVLHLLLVEERIGSTV